MHAMCLCVVFICFGYWSFTNMLPSLEQGQEQMSKSDPLSSTFMEDDEAKVNLKIKTAYCPADIVEGNPCLEYVKYLILRWFNQFVVERNAKNGGDKGSKALKNWLLTMKVESYIELILNQPSQRLSIKY
ncbi:tyrosine--tRNA ligase 1, cytoplasmic-like [Quercus lobata]|uniref:tyrosine--tRNA ligase 1, cytoplasmic-like n=1 Tax=Quercus lobata TaxID=97700 RepID=UPI00124687BD|nr:tyrosine--tRNA ligase 1, cytoplasmic-like [Quercus lobata]